MFLILIMFLSHCGYLIYIYFQDHFMKLWRVRIFITTNVYSLGMKSSSTEWLILWIPTSLSAVLSGSPSLSLSLFNRASLVECCCTEGHTSSSSGTIKKSSGWGNSKFIQLDNEVTVALMSSSFSEITITSI